MAAEPCAAADRRRGMAGARGRAGRARRVARGGAGRRLWAGNARARGPAAGRRHRRQSGVPAAAGRSGAARRRASAGLRRRCRPLARRRLVGARRPHAGALGRGLRAGEPHRDLARHARRLSRAQGPASCAVLPGVSGRAVRAQPAGRFPRLRAHAGADERDLFRARLSRALSRLPAGRRRGPDRARRRRLHPHGVRPQARRSAPAPPRRRLRRSARAQCPLASRRARPGAGGARRHGRDRQFARLRRGRGARAPELSAGAGAGRARPRSRAAQCRDLVARPGAARAPRSSIGSTRW